MIACYGALAVLLLTGPTDAETPPAHAPLETRVVGMVKVIREVDVPAATEGKLKTILVRRGDEVQRNAVLAQLDLRDALVRSESARAERESAKLEADSDLREKSAELNATQAAYELRMHEELNRDASGTVPDLEIKRLQAAHDQAKMEMKLARMQTELAANTYVISDQKWELAKNNIADRDVTAPLDGVVVEVLKPQGEWVTQGDAVIRLAQMNRLTVEAFFDTTRISPHNMRGGIVEVRFDFPDEESVILQNIAVDFVAHRIEADGTCRFAVEIDNLLEPDQQGASRWQIRPGMRALITFQTEFISKPNVER